MGNRSHYSAVRARGPNRGVGWDVATAGHGDRRLDAPGRARGPDRSASARGRGRRRTAQPPRPADPLLGPQRPLHPGLHLHARRSPGPSCCPWPSGSCCTSCCARPVRTLKAARVPEPLGAALVLCALVGRRGPRVLRPVLAGRELGGAGPGEPAARRVQAAPARPSHPAADAHGRGDGAASRTRPCPPPPPRR